ncbi:MAG: ArsR family transcriptional regulator [Sneathiella sp.]|nr:MAG: ArsR family transcriptional regulator [Sneathiella sp.]
MTRSIDSTDRKILNLLQKDNRLSAEELGAKIGASRSSIQRRIKQLRTEGIIEADISIIKSSAFGQRMTFIVEVELERERIDLLDEFRRSALALDEVQQCYYVTGHTDFILIVTAANMEDYEIFTRRVFIENPNIRRFHSNVVVDRVKVGLHIPLGD